MRKVSSITIAALLICAFALRSVAQVSGSNRATTTTSDAFSVTNTMVRDSTSPSINPDLERRNKRYRLCASDVIALTFPLTPEFDQTVSIQPDGFASLVGVGDVLLEGLTTQDAVEVVRRAYADALNNPVVTIELKDFNKPYFIVSGQVGHPGKYDLRGETSATQAIAVAGGFNELAKHSQVLLFRRVNSNWYEVKPLNLKRILNGHDVSEDPEVRPGDMLYVPQSFFSKIKKFIPSSGLGAYYQLHP